MAFILDLGTILRDNWLLLLIGSYPNGPLGGIACTLILSVAGIALAFFVQGRMGHDTALAEAVEQYGPTTAALGVSTIGVLGFALPAESKRVSREALLGLGYALFGGTPANVCPWAARISSASSRTAPCPPSRAVT